MTKKGWCATLKLDALLIQRYDAGYIKTFPVCSKPSPTPSPTATPATRSIKISYPNGGETFKVGDKVRITWTSTKIDKVSLGYSFGFGSLNPITSGTIPNQGYYDWTVNIGNTTNTKVKIDIIGYETGVGSVTDQSDNFFTVNPASPTPSPTPTSTPKPSPSPSTIPAPSSYKRVFKTSDSIRTYSGNLIVEANSLPGEQVQVTEGLKAADKICQYRANSRNLGGTWKAWLSDSKTSASSRLTHANVPYKRLDGVMVANNWVDLTDGGLQATINVTEFGVKTLDAGAWTNTLPNGERKYTQTSKTCYDWTTRFDFTGSQGYDFNTNSGWTDSNTLACGYSDSLYCFEQ